ncbi:MAG: hypothetical protein ACLFUS_01100 [Candidatus Sumerlaeia bacterium]
MPIQTFFISPRLLFIIVLCLAVLCVGGCNSDNASDPIDIPEEQEPQEQWLEISGIRAEIYEGASLQSRVEATSASIKLESHAVELGPTTTTLYNEGEWTGRLTAKESRVYLEAFPDKGLGQYDVDMLGYEDGVELITRNGTRIRTPFMRYDNTNKQVFSGLGRFEKRLRLGDRFLLITGAWFRANKELTQFDDYGNVHVRGVPEEEITDGLPEKSSGEKRNSE